MRKIGRQEVFSPFQVDLVPTTLSNSYLYEIFIHQDPENNQTIGCMSINSGSASQQPALSALLTMRSLVPIIEIFEGAG